MHPKLKKFFTYDLDSPYIALQSDSSYFTIPLHDDILTCTISAGHFCNLNTPLYPVDTTTECIYHLLVNDKEKIGDYCKILIKEYSHDVAINLENNIWALAVLEPTELHVTCLSYSYQIDIETNFQIIKLENSRQAYSPNLILPSGNQMTEERNGSLIKQRFFNYDVEYTDIPNFFLMQTFNITHLTSDEVDALSIDLPPIDRITVKNVTEMLKPIDKNYPFVFPIYGYVLITIGGTIMVIMVLYYAKYHRGKAMRSKSRKSNKFPPSAEAIVTAYTT